MKYSCEACNYVSDNLSNFSRHNKSRAHRDKLLLNKLNDLNGEFDGNHIEMASVKNEDGTITATITAPMCSGSAPVCSDFGATKRLQNGSVKTCYTCQYCGCEFTRLFNLNRHNNRCANKKEYIAKMENDKKEYENKLAQEKKEERREHEHETEKLKIELQFKDHEIQDLKKEIDYLKTLVSGCGNIVQTTVNAMTFAQKRLTDGPVLKQIDRKELKQLTVNTDYNFLAEMIIGTFDQPDFVEIVTLIILRQIVKVDPRDNAVWNTDSSRQNYIVRIQNDDAIIWTHDKGARKLMSMVINPIFDIMRKRVKDYVDDMIVKSNALAQMDQDIDHLDVNIRRGTKVVRGVFTDKLKKKVIKRLNGELYLDKNKINNKLKGIDLDNVDREICASPDVISALNKLEDEHNKKIYSKKVKRNEKMIDDRTDRILEIQRDNGNIDKAIRQEKEEYSSIDTDDDLDFTDDDITISSDSE